MARHSENGTLDRGFTEAIAVQLFLAGGHPIQTAGRTVTVHTTHCLQRKRLLAMACGIAPGPVSQQRAILLFSYQCIQQLGLVKT